MSLIRAILNNGFFIIVLIIAITLYLMYSDKIKRDHGIKPNSDNAIVQATDTPSPAIQKTTENTGSNQPQKPAENNLAETSSTEKQAIQSDENNKSVNTDTTNATVENDASTDVANTTAEANDASTDTANTTAEANDSNNDVADTAVENEVQATAKSAEDSNVNTKKLTENTPPQSEETIATSEQKSETETGFANIKEALLAATQAYKKNDFTKASAIYLDIAKKQPSPSILGFLANSLYQEGKTAQASQAWLDSAKLLVKENRLQDANMLASRLVPYAPKAAREIHMNVQRIYQKQMALRQHHNQVQNAPAKPMTNFQPQQAMPPMQKMQPMSPMQKMQPMPPMQKMQPMSPMQKMQPMSPMQKMQPMPPMQTMKPMPPMLPMQKMKPMPPMQKIQPMPPMQTMKPMPPMHKMQPMPPMQKMPPMPPMQKMPPMSNYKNAPQPSQEFLEMQKKQRAAYQRYLDYMRHQNAMMQSRMQPPLPQNNLNNYKNQ